VIDPVPLQGRDRYERVIEGWVDNTHPDAFTHTVRLEDDDLGVELSAVATPSPSYEIREAWYRLGPAAVGFPPPAPLPGLAGARMVGGFTRQAADAVAGLSGAGHLVDAAIEVARLARQVAKLPPERAARATAGPWECWQLDTTGWIDLPNSCFAYSDAGRALFGTRAVTTAMVPELYSPPPGAGRVFVRRKVARLERRERRLALFNSMHDNVHGFDIRYEVDLVAGVIVAAESRTPRLPYRGICTEPQARIATLVGQVVDRDLRRRMQTLIGGAAGCAQLYDLTADLLRLLRLY
jgi:DUF2889 family protein